MQRQRHFFASSSNVNFSLFLFRLDMKKTICWPMKYGAYINACQAHLEKEKKQKIGNKKIKIRFILFWYNNRFILFDNSLI